MNTQEVAEYVAARYGKSLTEAWVLMDIFGITWMFFPTERMLSEHLTYLQDKMGGVNV